MDCCVTGVRLSDVDIEYMCSAMEDPVAVAYVKRVAGMGTDVGARGVLEAVLDASHLEVEDAVAIKYDNACSACPGIFENVAHDDSDLCADCLVLLGELSRTAIPV